MNKLDSFIKFLVYNVPYYMNYSENDQLVNLPIVNKQVIRNNYEAFISRNIPKEDREKILQILKGDFNKKNGSVNEVYEYKNFIFEETTGTSGVPFRVVKSEEDRFRIGAEVWRRRCKIDVEASPKTLYRLNHTGIKSIQLNTYNYEVDRNARKHYDFSSLTLVSCSGALLSEQCYKKAQERFGCKIVNMYGMTEASSLFSCQYCKAHESKEEDEFQSVGFPLVGNKFRIWNNDENREAKSGEIGEVHIISETLMLGYLGDEGPELDEDGYWRTRDMGFRTVEGELYIIGRKDRMIISCGHNVFPEYIERIIKNSGLVDECIVTGIQDSIYGEKIVCMYINKEGNENVEEQLRKICVTQLAQYEMPYSFRECDKFTYTSSGKICINI